MRMPACGWAERRNSVPSPHVGEGQGGGTTGTASVCYADPTNIRSRFLSSSRLVFHRHPPPCPSPTWGEGTVWRAPSQLSAADSEMCACPSACAGTTAASFVPNTLERPGSHLRGDERNLRQFNSAHLALARRPRKTPLA